MWHLRELPVRGGGIGGDRGELTASPSVPAHLCHHHRRHFTGPRSVLLSVRPLSTLLWSLIHHADSRPCCLTVRSLSLVGPQRRRHRRNGHPVRRRWCLTFAADGVFDFSSSYLRLTPEGDFWNFLPHKTLLKVCVKRAGRTWRPFAMRGQLLFVGSVSSHWVAYGWMTLT